MGDDAVTDLATDSRFVRIPVAEDLAAEVVVLGGGIAGVYAALGAARQGAGSVILVEQLSFLGGQATAGGVHTFCGETESVNDAWREMLDRLAEFDGGIAAYDPDADGRRFDAEALKYVLLAMLVRAGVQVYLHTRLISATRACGSVTELHVAAKSGVMRLRAAQVVDATGDADVVAAAGLPTESGGPGFAPGSPDPVRLPDRTQPYQLPMSFYFMLVDTGRPVHPHLPEDSPSWENDESLPMTTIYGEGPLRLVKMKVVGFDATRTSDLTAAERVGRQQVLALVYHLQTKGYAGKTYPTYRLAWVAPQIGVREGRRICAERSLTLDDLRRGATFGDVVGVGSYHIDYHWPTDVRRAGTGLTAQMPPYHIPLRAMIPLGSENLLVPGRCMGGEQIAMSSYRVMGICAQSGFGAGVAAAMAATTKVAPRQLDAGRLRDALRRHGVRFDAAPYLNYLRSRRLLDETLQRTQAVMARVCLLPDGVFRAVWIEDAGQTFRVMSIDRRPDGWGEPVSIAALDERPGEMTVVVERPERLLGPGYGPRGVGSAVQETAEPLGTVLTVAAGGTVRRWGACSPGGWEAKPAPAELPVHQGETELWLSESDVHLHTSVSVAIDLAGSATPMLKVRTGRGDEHAIALGADVTAADVCPVPQGLAVVTVSPGAIRLRVLGVRNLTGGADEATIHDERHASLLWADGIRA